MNETPQNALTPSSLSEPAASLHEDSKRLDWFRLHPNELMVVTVDSGWEYAYRTKHSAPWEWSAWFVDLRTCIDAAIAASSPGETL